MDDQEWIPCHPDGAAHGLVAENEGYCRECNKAVPLEIITPGEHFVLCTHAYGNLHDSRAPRMCLGSGRGPDPWPENTIDPIQDEEHVDHE